MSDMKPRGAELELDGKVHHLLFTLNAIDELQEKFDENALDALREVFSDYDEHNYDKLRTVITILLNDEAEREKRAGNDGFETVTEKDVGYMLGMDNFNKACDAVVHAYNTSMPEPDEDDNPNQTSEQTE